MFLLPKVIFCLLFAACLISDVVNTIVHRQGYTIVRKSWDEYANKSSDEVKKIIASKMPGVEFKVYNVNEYDKFPEEFYINKVRLVVDDNNNVVLSPNYAGLEPDVNLVKDAVNMSYCESVNVIKKKIPKAKIVVQKVYEAENEDKGHILIEADEYGTVSSPPRFVISEI